MAGNDASASRFEVQAYCRMYAIRCFEETSLALSRTTPPAAAGSMHLCAGQEAIPVGAMAALRNTDAVVATYRGHGWALEAGVTSDELLAEICHRAAGINGGRAGSAYIMAPWRRFIGENSIVGAGGPIGAGVALSLAARGAGDLVIVSFGDGAMSQGALHESLVFAANRNLPVIFLCENNGWSEMTATSSMIKVDRLSKRAQGYGIPGATIDGGDPLIVRDSIAMAAARIRAGSGPCLIECNVPRLWGHYNRDIEHYRSRQDREQAAQADPIARLHRKIIEAQLADEAQLASMRAQIESDMAKLAERVTQLPMPDPRTAAAHVYCESARSEPQPPTAAAESTEMTYAQAVNAALRIELANRPEVVVFGEDVGNAGGIFGVTRGLQREFGEHRVFDTPIAEAAILGSAVGAAIAGMRPIVEIMWADFLLVALDQLINQAANVRYITEGRGSAPLVVRTQQGATPGSCAQHSQSLEALLAHVPGIRVGVPSNPQDAYSMLRAAVAGDDPTILFEARSLYQLKEPVAVGGSIEAAQGAKLRADGRDLAIITWGTMVQRALDAATQLREEGIAAAVLDLRWLSPLDDAAIADVVARCAGRVIVVHEANLTGGFGAEIAARISSAHWTQLCLPVRRIGAPDIRMPASPVLQQALLPSASSICQAARQMVQTEARR